LKIFQKINKNIINVIKEGGVGVLPTDTLYGLVALALNKKAVKRVYQLKKRNPQKPCIILISSLKDLDIFGVCLSQSQNKFLKRAWPGRVSVVLMVGQKKQARTIEMSYLKPLNQTLAFRMPKPAWLRSLLKKTGPLIAPSCNPEGLEPAKTIKQAKEYFGDKVDFYLNKKTLQGSPSTLITFQGEEVVVLRQGEVKLK